MHHCHRTLAGRRSLIVQNAQVTRSLHQSCQRPHYFQSWLYHLILNGSVIQVTSLLVQCLLHCLDKSAHAAVYSQGQKTVPCKPLKLPVASPKGLYQKQDPIQFVYQSYSLSGFQDSLFCLKLIWSVIKLSSLWNKGR